jgi:MoaA/NifB/PqqE/SkfB family radical SAM enzyme
MYACSPKWAADWIPIKDLEKILTLFSNDISPSPFGPDRVGLNYGLHFTGGEPFLNFDLLLEAVKIANDLNIPSTFVETNSFWCVSEETAKDRMLALKNSGLKGILISVNPFILENVSFKRTENAIRVGSEIFGKNMMVYQDNFYTQFKGISVEEKMSFEEYLQKVGIESLSYIELIPMGRAVYKFANLYRKFPAEKFFKESCIESLTRNWHVHIDNYCNYIAGYCGGISLGDAIGAKSIFNGIDFEEYPILGMLATNLRKLYDFGVKEFGYKEIKDGYISKCHLCLDIRRHIVSLTDAYRELCPREFYFNLQ